VTIDLTDEERAALANMLTVEIEASKFPLSARIEMLKRIRATLRGEEPSAPVGGSPSVPIATMIRSAASILKSKGIDAKVKQARQRESGPHGPEIVNAPAEPHVGAVLVALPPHRRH
jgi:hypothetical protein